MSSSHSGRRLQHLGDGGLDRGSDLPETGREKRHSDMLDPAKSEAHQDPFHNEGDQDGTNYKSMEWWQAAVIMIAETVSIGILSLPSVLVRVGLAPGIILIAGLGSIATYTAHVLWQLKMAYPWIHTYADAAQVIGTPIGCGKIFREVIGAAQVVFLIFVMGSHVLTWTIMLNVITGHATCTIVWSVIGLVLFWLLDLPRTLRSVSWLSIVSCLSILSAVLITMIDVGVAPPSPGTVSATEMVEFSTAFNAVSNIIFAYGGHSAFFQFMSEVRDLREFPKAIYALQATDTLLYLLAAIVISYYAGDQVTSPAIGSAGPLVAKVAWGIAIPTILVAGVVYGHVAAKYIYVRTFRGTPHLTAKSFYSYSIWAAITLGLWIAAWIIAESIPSFNDLLSLISALFAAWFSYGLSGLIWLFLNHGQWFSSPKKVFLTFVNCAIFVLGGAICGIGLYASGKAIHDSPSDGSWTCADNSSS